jgi:hypothetical protein
MGEPAALSIFSVAKTRSKDSPFIEFLEFMRTTIGSEYQKLPTNYHHSLPTHLS